MRSPESLAPFEAALAAVDGARAGRARPRHRHRRAARRCRCAAFPTRRSSASISPRACSREARANAAGRRVRGRVATRGRRCRSRTASFDLVTLANMIPFFDELAACVAPGGSVLFAFSVGAETPIYVPPERLRAELAERGFTDFAEFAPAAGRHSQRASVSVDRKGRSRHGDTGPDVLPIGARPPAVLPLRSHRRCRAPPASVARHRAGRVARAGIEPATPRFSAVCSTN